MPPTYHHGNLREELLTCAVRILDETGIEQLSLRALARDLGVSHAAPLRHFKTKTDLLAAIAIEGAQRLLDGVRAASDGLHARARLFAISAAYIDWAVANPAYYQVLRNPDVMRHAPPLLDRLLTDFAQGQRDAILAAQAQGWRAGEDLEAVFLHLTALTVGSAVVATDPTYARPQGVVIGRGNVLAPVGQYLGMPETIDTDRRSG